MAVVRVIAENDYAPLDENTPRVYNLTFNIPADVRMLKITFTCVNWPLGEVGSVAFARPDGSPGGARNFIGGQRNKQGQVAASQSMTVEGPGPTMAAGLWSANVSVIQPITTAVTVERFT